MTTPPAAPDVARLRETIRARGFRQGDFTLTSGRKSDVFFDLKSVLLDPHAASAAGKALWTLVVANLDAPPRWIGGLAVGAVPLVCAVLAHAREDDPNTNVRGFFARKDAKAHGLRARVEGLAKGGRFQPDDPVVVVDDVATTGGSTLLAVAAARDAGANVVAAACLVDREEGAAERLRAEAGLPLLAAFRRRDFVR